MPPSQWVGPLLAPLANLVPSSVLSGELFTAWTTALTTKCKFQSFKSKWHFTLCVVMPLLSLKNLEIEILFYIKPQSLILSWFVIGPTIVHRKDTVVTSSPFFTCSLKSILWEFHICIQGNVILPTSPLPFQHPLDVPNFRSSSFLKKNNSQSPVNATNTCMGVG